MSRRTKLKVRNMRLFLTKNVFNSRYIVRNILAFTIMVTVVAMCAGNNNIGDLMSFRPARYVDTSTLGTYKQIGNHVFFK